MYIGTRLRSTGNRRQTERVERHN